MTVTTDARRDSIDTGKVTGRRPLRFASYQEILDDARRISQVRTRALGNWSLGEICQHLAKTIDMSIDGAPFLPPFYVRMLARPLKGWFLSRPVAPGFRLPKNASAILPSPTSDAEGLASLERAVARLQATSERKPSPVFGVMTLEEWDKLHFGHCAMHLSFIVPA